MASAKKPLIDADQAVRTALELIDEDGFATFSIEKLGRRLGVRGPSLYHHFADRADLLGRVAELILADVPDVFDEHEADAPAWDEGLIRMCIALRAAVLRHPNCGEVLLRHFPRNLVLGYYEHVTRKLTEAGIPDHLHVLIMDGCETITLGSTLYQAAFPEVDQERHPALARAVDANVDSDETLFLATLEAFLRGVEDLVKV